jgi:succinoglycan biosynthesis transport protein ExoP
MNKEIDIKLLWLYFKKHYKLSLAIILMFIFVGVVYILSVDKIYVAETSIFIDPQQKNVVENVTSEKSSSDQLSKSSIESQISILSSRKVIFQVIDWLIRDIDSNTEFGKKINNNRNIVTDYIKQNLIITHSDDTYIINIQYRDTDPVIASKVANFFADAYIAEQVDAAKKNSSKARLWLSQKIDNLKKKVSESNKIVQDFKVKYNFFASSKNLINGTNSTSSINEQLAQIRGDTALAKARYEHSQNLIKNRNIDAALAEALDNNVINGIRSKYLDRKKKYYELARTLGNDHQVAKKLRSEIQEYETLIFSEMERFARTQLSAYEISKLQEKTLEAKLTELLTVEKNNSISQTKLADLEQKANTYQNILEDFIEKYENLEQKEDFTLTTTRIISEAIPPIKYSSPKEFLILGIMTCLGGAVVFIIILYLASKDNSLRTAEEIFQILGFKNLGYIPKQKNNYRHKRKNHISKELFNLEIPNYLIAQEGLSPLINETFRKVKYKIDAIEHVKNNCKSIGITSSKSNEGKTTIAISLAQYLANLGHKTLLIDFDTYNPMLNNDDFSYDVPTLKDYFHNNIPFDFNKILKDCTTGLYIIPGVLKKTKEHISLNMQEIELMFNYLSKNFEYIICDLPPLSVTADTEMTIQYINGFIAIVEWAKTEANILKNGLISVGLSGGSHDKVIGTIINKIDLKKAKNFTDLYGQYLA